MTRKEELLGGDLIALSAAIDSSIPTTMQSSNADAFAEVSWILRMVLCRIALSKTFHLEDCEILPFLGFARDVWSDWGNV